MKIRVTTLAICLSLAGAQARPPVFTSLHSFGGDSDGATPTASLVADSFGVLYGVTLRGGTSGVGTVFSVTPPASAGAPWTESVLWSFGAPGDGQQPSGALAIGAGGVLYGITSAGGAHGAGTVFSLAPPPTPGGPWTEAILYSFTGGADGAGPQGPLTLGSRGTLYGTTIFGGTSAAGNVYSLEPPSTPGGNWTQSVLFSFTSGLVHYPLGGLVLGKDRVLYGATSAAVFSLIPPASPGASWTEADVFYFYETETLQSGLVLGSGGVLYGTTYNGGNTDNGEVFSLTPPKPGAGWGLTVLYNFPRRNKGRGDHPLGALWISRKTGVIYGTTTTTHPQGGAGVVFLLRPQAGNTWKFRALHVFNGADGKDPIAGVIQINGTLYGTTERGGTHNAGTVFAVTP